MNTTITRAKRFARRDDPSPFQLTDRDLRLLAHVARHRFLSSAHLAALDGGSPQNVLRCLRVLFDHEYLDRPTAQKVSLSEEGPRPFVYGLGKKGARALRALGHRLDDALDWTEKNKRAGAIFIEHTLEVADFMTGVELACRTRGDAELMREHEVLALAPEETRTAREPLRWKVDKAMMGRRETFSVVPDGLFGLQFPDETAAYFVLEVDRGTIPLVRTDVAGTPAWRKSISYKLSTYWEGWKAGQHSKQFGVKQVRVAMVTSSAERVRNMLSVVDEITEGKGSNFFLFIDRETLGASNPLDVEWTTGKGEMVRLTD
jgi:protein involved in plasmid replication-relaxation